MNALAEAVEEEIDELITATDDPTAGGNDNQFRALGKSKAVEATVGIVQKPKVSAAALKAKQAKDAEGRAPNAEGDELQELLSKDGVNMRQLLEWLAKQNLDMSMLEDVDIGSLPDGLRNIGSRRQLQIAVQIMLMMQLMAHFNMQQNPNLATPQQMALNQVLIMQLMQLAKQPNLTPQMLNNLIIFQKPEAMAAIMQLRNNLQQAGLISVPMKHAEMLLRVVQAAGKEMMPLLQQIQKNLEQKLLDPRQSPTTKRELQLMLGQLKQLQTQLQALMQINPKSSPQQIMQLLNQMFPVQGQSQTLSPLSRMLQTLMLTNPREIVGQTPINNRLALLVRDMVDQANTFQLRLERTTQSNLIPANVRESLTPNLLAWNQLMDAKVLPQNPLQHLQRENAQPLRQAVGADLSVRNQQFEQPRLQPQIISANVSSFLESQRAQKAMPVQQAGLSGQAPASPALRTIQSGQIGLVSPTLQTIPPGWGAEPGAQTPAQAKTQSAQDPVKMNVTQAQVEKPSIENSRSTPTPVVQQEAKVLTAEEQQVIGGPGKPEYASKPKTVIMEDQYGRVTVITAVTPDNDIGDINLYEDNGNPSPAGPGNVNPSLNDLPPEERDRLGKIADNFITGFNWGADPGNPPADPSQPNPNPSLPGGEHGKGGGVCPVIPGGGGGTVPLGVKDPEKPTLTGPSIEPNGVIPNPANLYYTGFSNTNTPNVASPNQGPETVPPINVRMNKTR